MSQNYNLIVQTLVFQFSTIQIFSDEENLSDLQVPVFTHFDHLYEERFPTQATYQGCGIVSLFFARAIMLNIRLKYTAHISKTCLDDLKFQLMLEFLQEQLNPIPDFLLYAKDQVTTDQ